MSDKDFLKKYSLAAFSKPKKTPSHPNKKGIVAVKIDGKPRIIRFGDQKMGHNYSPAARKSFKARHGKNISKGPSSAVYWADKFFWAGSKGSKKRPPASQKVKKYAEGGSFGPGDTDLLDEEILIRQAYRESAFDPKATSSAGARGLAQIMPDTEKELVRINSFKEGEFDALDPIQSIKAQRDYMSHIIERPWIKGSDDVKVAKALMAYNMGPQNALDLLNDLIAKGVNVYDSFDDFSKYLNKETREYVEDIIQEFKMRDVDGVLVGKTEESYIKDLPKYYELTASNS